MKIGNLIIVKLKTRNNPICPRCGEQKIVFGYTIKPSDKPEDLELFCASGSCNFAVRLYQLKTPVGDYSV